MITRALNALREVNVEIKHLSILDQVSYPLLRLLTEKEADSIKQHSKNSFICGQSGSVFIPFGLFQIKSYKGSKNLRIDKIRC